MFKNKLILIILIIGAICIPLILRDAGNSLVINEHPSKSDIIVVLSGGGKGRLEKGVELYKQGFAPYLMISNGAEDNLYTAALKLGVPKESVIIENQAASTRENAIFTKKLMIQYGFKSAIIVSSNYHMRRVNMNYEQIFKGSRLRLIYCSVNDNYNPKQWWLSIKDFRTTYIEYIKIAGNYFGLQGEMAKRVLRVFS